jgi:hypothetical protein
MEILALNNRLFLIRNTDSPLFESFGLEKGEKSAILIQNGVLSTDLREKGVKVLKEDARERGVETGDMTDYDGILDAILESNVVITI